MLTDAERDEIRELTVHVPERASASVEALLAVQRRRGWVSDEALADVAREIGMAEVDLDGVATFYSRIHRKPVGRHVVAVCDSVSCFLLGGETLLRALERRLGVRAGQTTADGAITLIPSVCLGHCDRSPCALVDERIVGPLDEARLDALIAELRADDRRWEARGDG